MVVDEVYGLMSYYREWDGELVLPSPLYYVPSLIRVGTNEVTCKGCGETFNATFRGCPRCANDTDGVNFIDGVKSYAPTETVPTTSYLREDEFYYVT